MLNRILFLCLVAALPGAVLAQTLTRFEQDDPRITYTGTWYPNTNSLESGGSALLANLKGSQVVVIFNGTGITWVGASDHYSGICYLTLDGAPVSVDTSNASSATLYQQPLFSVRGLASGLHRMTIEAIHSHDESTNASWIWVDAFDVENGSLVTDTTAAGVGQVQQTDIAANYSGHWFENAGSQFSGGNVNLVVDEGAHVDLKFNGTSITWIGYRDEWSGVAQVLLDGALQATVDTYLTPSQARAPIYSLTGLAPGRHVLRIVATGTHSEASAGSWVWVDAFQISGSAAANLPTINAGGIVNAASLIAAPNNQVAPGQIVTILGKNFLAAGISSADVTPLPTQLGPENTTLTACGQALPLFSVSPDHINAQIPFECPSTGSVTVTVTAGGQTGSQTFTLAPTSPGIFTLDASGKGAGVIVHADNSLVDATRPAGAGEEVTIYATGLGATSPSFATGTAANQVNATLLTVSVMIGGMAATVTHRGLAEGWVGLYQVSAIVPSGLTGSQPVVITVGSSYSSRAGVTMSVQ